MKSRGSKLDGKTDRYWVKTGWKSTLMRGMSFASLMGITAILIHSWVDFNLYIPANAVFFMVLIALGWISLYMDRQAPQPAVAPAPAEPAKP